MKLSRRNKKGVTQRLQLPLKNPLIPNGNSNGNGNGNDDKMTKRKTIQTVTTYLLIGVFLVQAFYSYSIHQSVATSAATSAATSTSTGINRRLEFVHITKTGGSAIELAGYKDGIIWGACHYMNITELGCMAADLPYTAPPYQSYALTSPWHTPPKLLNKYVNEDLNPYTNADLFVVIRNPYSRVLSEFYCPWTGINPKYQKGKRKQKDSNDPKIMNEWVRDMVTRLSAATEEFHQRNEGDIPKKQARGVNEDKKILAQKHYVNQAEYVYDGDKVVVKNIVHYETLSADFDALMKKYGIQTSIPSKEHGGVYTEEKKKLTYRDLDPETIAIINKFAKPDFEKFGYQMVDKFEKDDGYSLEAKMK